MRKRKGFATRIFAGITKRGSPKTVKTRARSAVRPAIKTRGRTRMLSTTRSAVPTTAQYTIGDVLRELKARADRKRFNHLAYRAVWVCKLMGSPPAQTPLNIPELRQKIAALEPATAGMTKHSLANLVWAFSFAVENSPFIDPGYEQCSGEISPEWLQVLDHAWSAHIKGSLSRVAYYCSRRGIKPTEFNKKTFAAFEEFWRSTRLVEVKTYHHPVLAYAWNEVVKRAPHLHLQSL